MLIDQLITRIIELEAPIVVGLDPRLEQMPTAIVERVKAQNLPVQQAAAEAYYMFMTGIIDAVHDLVPAVKPQIAFYEKLGVAGLDAYQRICDYAHQKGLIVIADVKRGDIGSTSQAYADGFIGAPTAFGESYRPFYSDFLTINPYLGTDGLKPFVDNCDQYDKGAFVLVKTSNKSSGELQDLVVEGETIYQKVAKIVEQFSAERTGQHGYSSIGAVVGATYPEQAIELRKTLKTAYFLVPGYGAQGATAADIVGCFDKNGLGAIVNSSRGIIFAYQRAEYDDDYQKAARQAVIAMKQDINQQLKARHQWYGK